MFRIGRLFAFMTVACALHAAVKLPALISDHMVLQQGMPVRIWGAADPGESVKVDFQGQSVTVKKGTPLVQVIPFKRDEWAGSQAPADVVQRDQWEQMGERVGRYKANNWQRKSYE